MELHDMSNEDLLRFRDQCKTAARSASHRRSLVMAQDGSDEDRYEAEGEMAEASSMIDEVEAILKKRGVEY